MTRPISGNRYRPHAVRRTFLQCGVALTAQAALPWMQAAHAETLGHIQQVGIIRIAVPSDFPPFGEVDTNMQLHGYDIDVARLIAAALQVDVALTGVTMADKIPWLETDKVDLLLNIGRNEARAKVVDFTRPYAPYYIGIFGPAAQPLPDVASLDGKSIAVVASSQEDILVTRDAPAGTVVHRYQNNSAAVSAFLAGQADWLATGNIVGAVLLNKHPSRHFAEKLRLVNSPVCAAVRKGDEAMLKRINAILLAAREDGQLDRLSQRWLGQPFNSTD